MGPCFGVGLLKALRRQVSPARLLAAKLDTVAMTLALLGFILALYLPHAANADALELAVLAVYPLGLLSAASLALLAIPFCRWNWLGPVVCCRRHCWWKAASGCNGICRR